MKMTILERIGRYLPEADENGNMNLLGRLACYAYGELEIMTYWKIPRTICSIEGCDEIFGGPGYNMPDDVSYHSCRRCGAESGYNPENTAWGIIGPGEFSLKELFHIWLGKPFAD